MLRLFNLSISFYIVCSSATFRDLFKAATGVVGNLRGWGMQRACDMPGAAGVPEADEAEAAGRRPSLETSQFGNVSAEPRSDRVAWLE